MHVKYFVGTDQPLISEVQVEICFIGIQCDLLVAKPLQKFATESLEEPLSTSDIEEADLDTCVQDSIYVFSMLSLGHIVISDLVVANLLMRSLSGMILLYLAVPFFTLKVFLHEISLSTLVLNSRDRHEKYGFLKKTCPESNLTTFPLKYCS